jgi:hypothetical protein
MFSRILTRLTDFLGCCLLYESLSIFSLLSLTGSTACGSRGQQQAGFKDNFFSPLQTENAAELARHALSRMQLGRRVHTCKIMLTLSFYACFKTKKYSTVLCLILFNKVLCNPKSKTNS